MGQPQCDPRRAFFVGRCPSLGCFQITLTHTLASHRCTSSLKLTLTHISMVGLVMLFLADDECLFFSPTLLNLLQPRYVNLTELEPRFVSGNSTDPNQVVQSSSHTDPPSSFNSTRLKRPMGHILSLSSGKSLYLSPCANRLVSRYIDDRHSFPWFRKRRWAGYEKNSRNESFLLGIWHSKRSMHRAGPPVSLFWVSYFGFFECFAD